MRRRVRKQAIGMALFPFLAVLICTMGALVVLLMLLVQQAKVEAETMAADQTALQELTEAERREQQIQYEDALWRQQVLETQRQEKQQELADKRLELSHIEDHIRRLEDTLRSAAAKIKEFQSGKPAASEDAAALVRQLADLERTLAAKRRELDDKRQSLAQAERSYTLVPYQGRSGTRRVPMYVECVAEGIVIQPEGILLTAADMDGPLGPGNPLDAALRAKREYLAQVTGGKGSEPYPLLVVRPSGVRSYSGALAAMKDWEDEFGYELVAEDLNLDFGERDPKAGQRLDQAVRDARRRQAVLMASMPRRYHDSPPVRGGSDSLPATVQRLAAQAPPKGTRGLGSSPSGGNFGTTQSGTQGAADSSQGAAAKAGHAAAAASGQTAPPNRATGQAGVAGQNSQRQGRQSGPGEGTSPIGSGFPPPGSTAKTRGQNWGLPAAAGRTFGVTRPIRVICLADRLVLLSDRRDAARPAEIQIAAEITPQQIDRFVTAIHRQMESWGLAAENGYWKPQLQVEVARDAEDRFTQLQGALQGSGIDVHRKVR